MFAYLPPLAKVYLYAVVFLFGAVMGSALNCLAYRLAREQKWSGGRSVCVSCGHTLGILDLVPIFSYLFLKGKCRHCGAKISPRYVLTEVFLGLCYASILARFGLTLYALSALVLVSCLFCLSLVDLDIQIIPDRFLLIPAVVQIAVLLLQQGWRSALMALVPAVIFGGGLLVLSLVLDKILKKDTMGGGDIKLMAVLGLFFSIPECLLLLILACVFGLVIASVLMKVKEDTPFPFGPALSLAAWVTLLIGSGVISWYLNLF